MSLRRTLCGFSLLLAGLPGCASTSLPNWCNPGPEGYQRNLAKKYDPYPDPTIGQPIVGGRPLEYLEPRPEPDVTKNQRFFGSGF